MLAYMSRNDTIVVINAEAVIACSLNDVATNTAYMMKKVMPKKMREARPPVTESPYIHKVVIVPLVKFNDPTVG